jgi:hypothetical protein
VAWHPVLSTAEGPPGRFMLLDGEGSPVAEIVFVRRGEECGYRATRLASPDREAELIGYYRTLLAAVRAAHLRIISTYSRPGGPIAHWE